MARRLDWDKASRDAKRARDRQPPSPSKKRLALRQHALREFAHDHLLACFKCGGRDLEWAKSGISARGPWIICVPCVNKRPADPPAAPTAEA